MVTVTFNLWLSSNFIIFSPLRVDKIFKMQSNFFLLRKKAENSSNNLSKCCQYIFLAYNIIQLHRDKLYLQLVGLLLYQDCHFHKLYVKEYFHHCLGHSNPLILNSADSISQCCKNKNILIWSPKYLQNRKNLIGWVKIRFLVWLNMFRLAEN